MNDKGIVFNQNVKNIAFDDNHYELMMARYNRFMINSEESINYYSDLDLEKKRALNIRCKALNKLDKLLVDFDTNFTNNGGKIIWANDAEEARQSVYDILNKERVRRILKTNSSTVEEINLTPFLESKKIKVVETNIGDYISALFDERAYSMRASVSGKTTSQIADLYTEKFGIKENCNAKQLTQCTKQLLKEEFLNPEAVVTGANFLVSNSGTLVLTENEGNIIKSTAFSPVHIVVAGIDKLINSIDELSVLLPLSSLYEARKNVSSFYHFINRPLKVKDETQKLYLILLNNNRTDVLAKKSQRLILSCIKCGACANVCPIYNTIGGHVYMQDMPGPVDSILYPITKGMEEAAHFCSLCTSCGRCTEVCPVNIPLKDLFIENRKDLVRENKSLISERNFVSFMMKKMSSRKNMDKIRASFKDIELSYHIKKKWGNKRELPKFANESFSEYWKNINKI